MTEDEILELSDPQYDFLESIAKHTGFVAGFGSGKSFIGTLKSLMRIIDFKIPKTAYYLPTYGDIKDIAFDGFPLVADTLGYKYRLNKSDKEFFLLDKHKKEIGKTLFRNMSEPESIVGYQVGYTLIDETDILNQTTMDKAFKKILGRNRLVVPVTDKNTLLIFQQTGTPPPLTYFHKKSKKLCYINCIDVAGTPEGFKWFYDRFVEKFNINTDNLIKASTYSNLHNLPEDFIDTLKAEYPENLFNAYVNGEFVNLTTGTIFGYFDRKKHDTDIVENETEALYIGQDWNVGGCISTVYIKRTIEGKQKLIQVDEIESYDTKAIITNLKNKYPNRSISIYPDASGNARKTSSSETDIQMLRQAGFMIYVNSRNPAVFDRITITNNCFDKEMVLVNCKRCPKTAKAYEQHSYDEKGQPMKFNGAGTVDDFTDSATYPLAYMFPINYEFRKIKISGI